MARIHTFVKRTRIPTTAAELFRWHEAEGAFERLTPPWERVEVLERSGGIRNGARVTVRIGLWPFRLRWTLEHREYEFGRQFCDVQVTGPFAHWRHVHSMEPDGANACFLADRIEFALPFGTVGGWIGAPFVRRKLERFFEYRHRVTLEAFSSAALPTTRAIS